MSPLRSLILLSLALFSVTAAPGPTGNGVTQALGELLDGLPKDVLHAVLQDHFSPKYRDGVFEDPPRGLEAVHSLDPELATRIVHMAKLQAEGKEYLRKRQDANDTSTADATSQALTESINPATTSPESSGSVSVAPVTTSPETSEAASSAASSIQRSATALSSAESTESNPTTLSSVESSLSQVSGAQTSSPASDASQSVQETSAPLSSASEASNTLSNEPSASLASPSSQSRDSTATSSAVSGRESSALQSSSVDSSVQSDSSAASSVAQATATDDASSVGSSPSSQRDSSVPITTTRSTLSSANSQFTAQPSASVSDETTTGDSTAVIPFVATTARKSSDVQSSAAASSESSRNTAKSSDGLTGVLVPIQVSSTDSAGSVVAQATSAFVNSAPTSMVVSYTTTNDRGQTMTTSTRVPAAIITSTDGSGRTITTTSPLASVQVASGGQIVSSAPPPGASSQSRTTESVRPFTTTDTYGNSVTISGSRSGQVVTTTDSKGRTVMVTFRPSAVAVSEVVFVTTHLPNGAQSTVTSLRVIDGGRALITSAIEGNASAAAQSTSQPGLQSRATAPPYSWAGGVAVVAGAFVAFVAAVL